jgi:glycolate oxidase FAD binding subunit
VRLELSAAAALNVSIAEPGPLSGGSGWQGQTWGRLAGAAPAVRAAREWFGCELIAEQRAQEWWNGLRHCCHPLFAQSTIWRLSLPATAVPLDLPGEPLIDWGGALRWYANLSGAEARARAVAAGGTAMCWKGSAPLGRFHPLPPALASLHRRLKQRFDPHGIFNPGRLLAAL